MSLWYEPKLNKGDFEISEDGKEIHIYLGTNEEGNIYVSIKVDEIKKVLTTQQELYDRN